MILMDQGQSRIVCPQCRANNFPGQPQCWQCKASLPPPEAVSAPPARPAAPWPRAAPPSSSSQSAWPATSAPPDGPPAWPVAAPSQDPSAWQAPAARTTSPWMIVAPIVLLVVLVVGVALFAAARSRQAATRLDPQAQLNALRDRLQQERGASPEPAPSPAPEAGSLEGEARREIDRLRRENDLSAPPADSSGAVHLQGGGSISREQWERTRSSLGNRSR